MGIRIAQGITWRMGPAGAARFGDAEQDFVNAVGYSDACNSLLGLHVHDAFAQDT